MLGTGGLGGGGLARPPAANGRQRDQRSSEGDERSDLHRARQGVNERGPSRISAGRKGCGVERTQLPLEDRSGGGDANSAADHPAHLQDP